MAIQFAHKPFGSIIGSGSYVFRHYGDEKPTFTIDGKKYILSTYISNTYEIPFETWCSNHFNPGLNTDGYYTYGNSTWIYSADGKRIVKGVIGATIIIPGYAYQTVEAIKFTYESGEYTAEKGMTWREYVNGPENTFNRYFYISGDYVYDDGIDMEILYPDGTYVHPDDVIQAGIEYWNDY